MARKNPSTATWLLLLGGGLAAYYLFVARKSRGGKGVLGPGPPPEPTATERAAMEAGYRYRWVPGAGGRRCFDYKDRKFVYESYCPR